LGEEVPGGIRGLREQLDFERIAGLIGAKASSEEVEDYTIRE